MKYIFLPFILFIAFLFSAGVGYTLSEKVSTARQTTSFYEGMYYGCLETASALAGVALFSDGEPFTRISVSCGMQINNAMQREVHRNWVR